MTIEDKLYKSSQAAKLLGVTSKTIRNYITGGQLKGTLRSDRWYIEGAELERFMKEGTEKNYFKKMQEQKKEGL